jgi:hypothetical protein
VKVLIQNDGIHAHFFERSGWLKAFNSMPNTICKMYECRKYPAYDIFDSFEPDIFIGQLYNLDSSLLQCIKERPFLKVALRAGDWGDIQNEPDYFDYNILYSTQEQIETLKRLKDETGQPEFVFTHYAQSNMQRTHGYFEQIGIKPVGIMLGADIFDYYGAQKMEHLACDVGFVGGYWPYKGININKTLLRLCHESNYNIKIFASNKWPVPNWCGDIPQTSCKHVFYSTKVCPNIHEPHSTKFGIDVNERSFKTMASGGFTISDNAEGQKNLFQDGKHIVYYDDNTFFDTVRYYLKTENEDKRKAIALAGQREVLENHTYFERIKQFLNEFGYHKEADIAKGIKHQVISHIK